MGTNTAFIVTALRIIRATNTKGVALLRLFVGAGLTALGIRFIVELQALSDAIPWSLYPLVTFMLAHAIIIVHIGGGLLIACGFLTRLAAIVQLPLLLGALTLVDPTTTSLSISPELALPFAFMVGLVVLLGAGRYSVDRWLARQPEAEPRMLTPHTTPAQ